MGRADHHRPCLFHMRATRTNFGILTDQTLRVARRVSQMTTMPNTLIMTVGLPRSGKTTWARLQGHPIVNPDSIRLGLYGQPFIIEAEPFVWATAKLMVRALFLAGHDTVILDATNTTKARRDEWLNPSWDCYYQVFPASEEVCISRVRPGHNDYLVDVIHRMALTYEPVV